MIVCSCAVISSEDIHRAIAWMRAADPEAIITPGKVYRALGKRPDCGGCISHFLATMRADRHTAVPVGARAGIPILRTARRGRGSRGKESGEDSTAPAGHSGMT